MCIVYSRQHSSKAVEAHRVIEPGHSNWMRPYIMLSISLKAAARNELGAEKEFFKLMNNSFWKDDEKYQKNVLRPRP